jgi:hypothetical protein
MMVVHFVGSPGGDELSHFFLGPFVASVGMCFVEAGGGGVRDAWCIGSVVSGNAVHLVSLRASGPASC